jgi:hypothetical protein
VRESLGDYIQYVTKPKGAMKVKASSQEERREDALVLFFKLASVALPRRLEKASRDAIIKTH